MAKIASNGNVPVPVPKNHTENGREFHGFRKGIYMYPCDEVSSHSVLRGGGYGQCDAHMALWYAARKGSHGHFP